MALGSLGPDLAEETSDEKDVLIGPLQFGKRGDISNRSKNQPNPTKMVWSQKFIIIEQPIVGSKPTTECTEEDVLWILSTEFRLINESDIQLVKTMKAGPYWVEDAYHSVCMYLEDKQMVRVKGYKDYIVDVSLKLKEAND
jgi:hypothetical protein